MCGQACGENGTLVYCWGQGCKLVQWFLENSMEIPSKIKNRTIIWFNNSTFGYIAKGNKIMILKRYVHSHVQFSCVRLFATPWTAARQASLSITNSQSSPKLLSIQSVMPSNHLILCHPLLRPPSIFPSIRVFSNESALRIRWPKGLEFQLQPFQWTPRADLL